MAPSLQSSITVDLPRRIVWSVSEDCPPLSALLNHPAWMLVDPRRCALRVDSIVRADGSKATIVFSRKLILGSRHSQSTISGRLFAEGINVAEQLLRSIRIRSRQYEIPTVVDRMTFQEGLPKPYRFSPRKFGAIAVVPKSLLDTTVAISMAVETPALGAVFGDLSQLLLLEAMKAHWELDYRRSQLYAGFALEAAVKDEIQQRAHQLRVADPGNEEVRTAVLRRLLKRAEFKNLFHEILLYLCGRSLLKERKELYDAVCKVYSTRGELAHGMGVSEVEMNPDQSRFASEALQTARDTLIWLTNDAYYQMPTSELEQVSVVGAQAADGSHDPDILGLGE